MERMMDRLILYHNAAPAEAGAHHVSQFTTISEIGSSLRWSNGAFCFKVTI
jgi:hypothetical protein